MFTDYSKAITAEDLIRRYDLNNLKKYKDTVIKIENDLYKTDTITQEFVKNVSLYRNQVSKITTWFSNGIPTDDPKYSENDLCYDNDGGKVCQKHEGIWNLVEDEELLESMAIANALADTGDGKRRIFYDTPTVPYDVGDIWIKDEEIYRASVTREGGTFKENEFVPQSAYNDQNVLKDVKAVLNAFITKVETNYTTKAELTTESDRIYGYVDAETIRTKQYSDGRTETAKNEVLSELSIEVGKINSKISNIGGITVQGTTEFATLELKGVNDSKPISVLIYPIGESICYTYPRSNIYPSSTLYSRNRVLDFYNKTTREHFKWELPTNLWYYDANTYDSMLMDLGDGRNPNVIVTRKCGVRANGTVYALGTPTTERYPYPSNFDITSGDYQITLLGYSAAFLDITLMASNLYTTQFPTFSEMRSEISQEAGKIVEKVEAKADKTELQSVVEQTAEQINTKVSKNNVISEINQTSESVTIDANKVSLNGKTINLTGDNIKITSNHFKVDKDGNINCSNAKVSGEINASSGTIGGWNMNADGLSNGTQFIGNNGYSNIYTMADIFIIEAYLMGQQWATQIMDGTIEIKSKYDLNGDGVVDLIDLLKIVKKVLGQEK